MTDFSREAQMIVEQVSYAMEEVAETARRAREPQPMTVEEAAALNAPTPFQRAVIGALVIIADGSQKTAAMTAETGGMTVPTIGFSEQELSAAGRAIAPFLDETPVPE
ncbi:MAG: hypothetical protein JWO85_2125 [Candidatus Eremiobacteraeota bacterium]|nr:hypothetical protein [Candidatus Eremiobacteraeota bacterium]